MGGFPDAQVEGESRSTLGSKPETDEKRTASGDGRVSGLARSPELRQAITCRSTVCRVTETAVRHRSTAEAGLDPLHQGVLVAHILAEDFEGLSAEVAGDLGSTFGRA